MPEGTHGDDKCHGESPRTERLLALQAHVHLYWVQALRTAVGRYRVENSVLRLDLAQYS